MTIKCSIGGIKIGEGEKVLVIGEIGVNHNGNPDTARKLIDEAYEVGLDAVKMQSFKAEKLVIKSTAKADYQKKGKNDTEDQYQMLKALELSEEDMRQLCGYAKSKGLVFISTPYDPESLEELVEMGASAIKISSADIVDKFLLEEAARAGLPLIISTGMAGMEDVARAVMLLDEAGAKEIVILHCVSIYPAPIEHLNMRFLKSLKAAFGYPVGFSDHTIGFQAAPLAVALGACVIEKHFTLDRTMQGPDHWASIGPEGMKEYIGRIREAEIILGSEEKELLAEERGNAELMRKSLVFSGNYPKGTVVERRHFSAKRPAGGLSPMDLDKFLGRKLRVGVVSEEAVRMTHFEG